VLCEDLLSRFERCDGTGAYTTAGRGEGGGRNVREEGKRRCGLSWI